MLKMKEAENHIRLVMAGKEIMKGIIMWSLHIL